MIQVDDSGWGSLLGGVYIAVYDTVEEKMHTGLIPVSFFQGENFETGKYLDKALSIASAGIQKFTGYPTDNGIDIQICRGYALSKVRDWAERNSSHISKIEYTEIGDPFQSLLETKLSKHLEKIGVPEGKGKGAHRISFDAMLDWVKEDFRRVKYVKTGWKSWQNKYGPACIQEIYEYIEELSDAPQDRAIEGLLMKDVRKIEKTLMEE